MTATLSPEVRKQIESIAKYDMRLARTNGGDHLIAMTKFGNLRLLYGDGTYTAFNHSGRVFGPVKASAMINFLIDEAYDITMEE